MLITQHLDSLRGRPDGSENTLTDAVLKDMLLVLRTIWFAPLNEGKDGWLASTAAAIDRFELHVR